MTQCIAACNLESFTELNVIQQQAEYGVNYSKQPLNWSMVNILKVLSHMISNEDRQKQGYIDKEIQEKVILENARSSAAV